MFSQCYLLVCTFIATIIWCMAQDRLRDTFHNVQILTPKHLHIRTARSLRKTAGQTTITLSFRGQKIVLQLKSGSLDNILLPGGHVQARHADGSKSDVHIDPNDFHVGVIQGHPDSWVRSVKFDEVWLIHTTHPYNKNLSFSIEPLIFYTRSSSNWEKTRQNLKMVAFRHHDIKQTKKHHRDWSGFPENNRSTKTNTVHSTAAFYSTRKHQFGKQSQKKYRYFKTRLKSVRTKSTRKNETFQRFTPNDVLGKPVIDTEIDNSNFIGQRLSSRNNVINKGEQNIRIRRRSRRKSNAGWIWRGKSSETKTKVINERKGRRKRTRTRREGDEIGDICDILSIIDYTFYSSIGHNSTAMTAKYIFQVFSLVNDIFKGTTFPYEDKLYRAEVQIRSMEILTDESLDSGFPHNVLYGDDGDDIIRDMTDTPYFNQFCLVHLSTARVLKEHTLGVAVIAMADGNRRIEGICGGYRGRRNNVGLSTVTSAIGRRAYVRPYSLVVAHELGHNFGSHHDNDTTNPECAPSKANGGKYLMWWRTTRGTYRNNQKFSNCSRKMIGRIIAQRKSCLLTKKMLKENSCGNGHLDFGEDCDAGQPYLAKESESCCDRNCRFTPRAVCSHFNHPCCKNCSVASIGTECTRNVDHRCDKPGMCNGIDHGSCYLMGSLPNGHECGIKGQCQNGKCINYCRLRGNNMKPQLAMEPCICVNNPKEMCSVCCRQISPYDDGTCIATHVSYPDDTPCLNGTCHNGVCRFRYAGLKDFDKLWKKDEDGDIFVGIPNTTLLMGIGIVLMIFCSYMIVAGVYLCNAK